MELGRYIPLSGVVFAVLTVASDLAIGPVPGEDATVARLTGYYAAHHGRIAAGGMLLAWSAIFLAFFGAALWERVRRASVHPFVAGAVLVGIAVSAASTLGAAGQYLALAGLGGKQAISGAALQAVHIGAAGGGVGGDSILLLAVGLAGVVARGMPRYLAWPAIAIGILELTPLGFLASLAFLLWAAVAGIALVLRPDPAAAGAPARRQLQTT